MHRVEVSTSGCTIFAEVSLLMNMESMLARRQTTDLPSHNNRCIRITLSELNHSCRLWCCIMGQDLNHRYYFLNKCKSWNTKNVLSWWCIFFVIIKKLTSATAMEAIAKTKTMTFMVAIYFLKIINNIVIVGKFCWKILFKEWLLWVVKITPHWTEIFDKLFFTSNKPQYG